MKLLPIGATIKWSLIMGVIITIFTYAYYFSFDFYYKRQQKAILKCGNKCFNDNGVIYITDLAFSEDYLKYINNEDSVMHFLISTLPNGVSVNLISCNKDSTLLQFYYNDNISGDPIKGYIAKSQLYILDEVRSSRKK